MSKRRWRRDFAATLLAMRFPTVPMALGGVVLPAADPVSEVGTKAAAVARSEIWKERGGEGRKMVQQLTN
jgi:hypothetical protein